MRTSPRPTCFFPSFVLATLAMPAQSVLHVGPGGFAQIDAAITAAQDGDLIRIAPGTYTQFQATKSVRLQAEIPATVVVTGSYPSYACGFGAAGRAVHVSGLAFRDVYVTAADGLVTFEDCAFQIANLTATAPTLAQFGGTLSLVRCAMAAAGATLHVRFGGYCSAVDSTFTSAGNLPIVNPRAVWVESATLQMSGCTLTGGSVTQPGALRFAGPGLEVGQNARVALVDCLVQGGDELTGAFPPAAGALLPLGGGLSSLRTHRTLYRGGRGPGAIQAPGLSGAATPGPLLGASMANGGFATGVANHLDLRGEPGGLLVAAATLELGLANPVPGLEQPGVGFLGAATVVLGFALGDGNGRASFPVTIPNLPGLQGLGVWLRGIEFATSPWQASPVLGGLVR